MVPPLLPLVLLESVRAHDRPREVLEDEDLAASLPRRLGLTGVVESQIRRYAEAERKGRSVPVEEVRDLFRLILRRPDAEPILRDAGANLAQRQYRRRTAAAVRIRRILPGFSAAATMRRAARSLIRRIACGASVDVVGWPLELRLRGAITADLDANGTACVLYAAALEELLGLYLRSRPRFEHRECASRGDGRCTWTWSEA